MDYKTLLRQITEISEKYDLLYQKTGAYFNIFEVTNTASDEVVMCRVLHELLSPAGSHYQGTTYLKLFLEQVLKLKLPEDELSAAKVFREYQAEGRRIDLVVETRTRFIPIEVKIYAGEQPGQCEHYYKYAQKQGDDNPKVYYLTRFGTSPSEYSINQNNADKIETISFSEDILRWLLLCLKQTNTIKIAPVREVLLQLLATIRKFTDKMEDEKAAEIKKLLSSSPECFKNAIGIQSLLTDVKTELMMKLFEAIEAGVACDKPDTADEYRPKVVSFYRKKGHTWPALSYKYEIKGNMKPDTEIWVRLEIEDTIFAGYCCPVNGKNAGARLTEEEIERILRVDPKPSTWWAYREDILDEGRNESPNFNHHNEAYYDLFDEDKFICFVSHCVNKIESLLAHPEN